MKPVMKNVTIQNDNEELVAFAQTIDFTELFEHIKMFAKVNCNFYQPEITTSKHGEVFISFMSDDITGQAGAFAAILERCGIHSFSNGVYRDRETDEIRYWVIASIQYEHKDGGSNGMQVTRAWYTDSDGWVFVDAGRNEG